MKKSCLFVASAALLAVTNSAMAADYDDPPPSAYDWSGPYIGLQAGYAWGDLDVTTFADAGGGPVAGAGGSTDIKGFIGGAHAGWNFQIESIVLGLEADINGSTVDGTFTFANGDDFTADIDVAGSFRGRLGFAFDRALIYGTGGLAIASVELGTLNFGAGIREKDTQTYVGYTVGGGIEYAFSDSLSGRIEYRYTDLGTENFDWEAAFPVANGDYDLDYHMVQGGLSWHF